MSSADMLQETIHLLGNILDLGRPPGTQALLHFTHDCYVHLWENHTQVCVYVRFEGVQSEATSAKPIGSQHAGV